MKRTVYLCCATLVVLFVSCKNNEANQETAETLQTVTEPQQTATSNSLDKNKLVGEWIRTDAPYQVKITAVTDSGSISAGYFNPNPIHVGKASWTTVSDVLQVYIELQDVNYPGSNYTLQYIPGKDKLAGKYFQAVEGTTYNVEFIRTK
ncbi:hypothetical protein [Flavihumibacter fluvii]|uniref:hypothetical protein n=1 Tax=Flavihumibacter fluvii TaxID=2838157 RepID=UPI001BDF37B6|nr:hypothetical protein [Flavihumibacter fluvii]ULQ54073.1 hypothetical protein KJS93_07040 [Flavihumibacter fluvii]